MIINDDETLLIQHTNQRLTWPNAIDEIREELNFDDNQVFLNDQDGNLESDQFLDAEQVSDEYLDFLLGFE